jgi:hypothetical protein
MFALPTGPKPQLQILTARPAPRATLRWSESRHCWIITREGYVLYSSENSHSVKNWAKEKGIDYYYA